ncbi:MULTISPECIES: hypothetical protein [unclassified Sphingomonas]|uniref:hypothetical protein n=1 Tax=unclassified Sphingomonas TaxID=196159 RepID=UPI00226AA73C|nr:MULTISPECIES: hypothetical protein [unclassified Sphingomonas]
MAVAHLRADCVRANPKLHSVDLRLAVRRALRAHSIAPSRFGRDAVNDPAFVARLLVRGSNPHRSTAARVRAYLAKLEANHA